MKLTRCRFNPRAFTLVEMLIVVSIIALLASLTMGGYTYAMRSSKRRMTTGTFEAIKLALERYNTDFGEYPETTGSGQMEDFMPSKSYDVSGAACLYQALSGDGTDKIKLGSEEGQPSDGKTEGDEVQNMKLVELPKTIWMAKNGTYVMIDGFAKPFQYIKAALPTGVGADPPAPTSINATYDLWSYSEDEVNIAATSLQSLEDPKLSVKWIKNW